MKHYYITTEPPIIATSETINGDEESTDKGWYVLKSSPGNCFYGENTFPKEIEVLKVVAGLQNQPTIDYSALSNEGCDKINSVNFIALEKDYNISIDERFKEGFLFYKSLNDKKWSDEDVRQAMYASYDANNSRKDFADNYINKLKQPQLIPIEAIVQDNKVKILKVL